MNDIICIYHGGKCLDGFTAAWVVWDLYPNADFHPANYGQEPPDVRGKRVIIVDFSYPPETLVEMAEKANHILLLDHHKTAIDAIKAYDKPFPENVCMFLDTEKSGAMLAWEFFNPDGRPPPPLVDYVQDRDLWRFEYPKTKAVTAYLSSLDHTFENWQRAAAALACDDYPRIIVAGETLMRSHTKAVEGLIKHARRMVIGGHNVPVVNLPSMFASEAGHILCQGEAFAAIYYDFHEKRGFSLRSVGDFDVAEIAKKYGGGGHKNAAGFSMPHGWEGEQ